MAPTSHHVTFRFRLPHALARHAPLGAWARSPRGCVVDVYETGHVVVTSADHLETFARKQALETAAAFLGAIAADLPAQSFQGELSAPSCRAAPQIYAVAVGAQVVLARTDPHRGPVIAIAREGPVQLDLINRIAG